MAACGCEPGAGASPLFPPRHEAPQQAREELLALVRRAPASLEQPGTRWQLRTIRAACAWLTGLTPSGVWHVLERLRLGYKLARDHIHSPDPDYAAKLADLQAALQQARDSGGSTVFLFAEELTCYRQPRAARAWAEVGSACQPLAERSRRSDTKARVGAAVNALSGRLTYRLAARFGVREFSGLLKDLRAVYPQAARIYLALDNWPVHYHPEVLALLEPQQTRWPLRTPPAWPREPSAKAERLSLPIQLLPLPTYASWLNPQEKVWRQLSQQVLRLHRLSDQWEELKQAVRDHLDQFKDGSPALLRYIGLTASARLYGHCLPAQAAPSG
jgi:hypothetical protein